MNLSRANLSASLIILDIDGGSHMSDMQVTVKPLDSVAMLRARAQVRAILTEWLHSNRSHTGALKRRDAGYLAGDPGTA